MMLTVKDGDTEKMGYVSNDSGQERVHLTQRASSQGSSDSGSELQGGIPRTADALDHGHIEGGRNKSDGFVDSPGKNGGYGDTEGLKYGKPEATVFKGKVMWHGMENGQLWATYPKGSVSDEQNGKLQKNLDSEQSLFYK